MGKRIILFLLTNLAVIVVASFILNLFGVTPYLTQKGLNYQSLFIFALIFGFAGAIISLLLSKTIAIYGYGVKRIQSPSSSEERLLFATVQNLAQKANIGMPEVGIYNSPEPNAFATGWNKNKSLVAVSTGLLQNMNQQELNGVLGHEISHIANGDMVTMTLLQGVLNTFVIFFARIVAFAIAQVLQKDEEGGGISTMAYWLISMVFEMVFGILASLVVLAFSRRREFRADAGSVRLVNKASMIAALQRLQQITAAAPVDNRVPSMAAFKISHQSRFGRLFASHPPLEARIEALQKMN
ncbi:MAG: htpX 1 [Gammaproteobacteria bacterium]|jgi:heat shock protein HtpX|nr:htpX 1 [Gammaproteobacteria bacterium]